MSGAAPVAPFLGTLLLAAGVSAVAAVAFLYAGRAFWRSRPPEHRSAPARAFVTYWSASAAFHLLSAATGALAAFGVTPFLPFLVAKHASLVLAATCLAGLAYYLLYLFTGRRGWLWPTVAFYAAVGSATIYYVQARGPRGVVVEPWKVDLVYAQPLSGVATAIVLLLLLPQIVGALAYGSLLRRVREPRKRYRIVILATAIFVWFSSALAAELTRAPFWQFVTRPGIGLAVAALVVLAFSPPRWLKARWPLAPEDALLEQALRERREAAQRALLERARNLI